MHRPKCKAQFVSGVNQAGTHHRPHSQLECEPSVANQLEVEKCLMWISSLLVQRPRVLVSLGILAHVYCHISDHRNSHVWVSLEAERQHRHADEENGHHSHYLPNKATTANTVGSACRTEQQLAGRADVRITTCTIERHFVKRSGF